MRLHGYLPWAKAAWDAIGEEVDLHKILPEHARTMMGEVLGEGRRPKPIRLVNMIKQRVWARRDIQQACEFCGGTGWFVYWISGCAGQRVLLGEFYPLYEALAPCYCPAGHDVAAHVVVDESERQRAYDRLRELATTSGECLELLLAARALSREDRRRRWPAEAGACLEAHVQTLPQPPTPVPDEPLF